MPECYQKVKKNPLNESKANGLERKVGRTVSHVYHTGECLVIPTSSTLENPTLLDPMGAPWQFHAYTGGMHTKTHHRGRQNLLRSKLHENAREQHQLVKPVHKTHRAENEADDWWREVQALRRLERVYVETR